MKDFQKVKPTLVFISYNKVDKEVAREIALLLVGENIKVWFDEWEISAGDSIVERISTGLCGCTHFIIIWSKNASKSNWARKELRSMLSKAIQSGSPRILPIIIDETPLPELISDIQYIKYKGEPEEDRRDIVTAITGHGPHKKFIRAIVKRYQEVIRGPVTKYPPFGFIACPKCGSDKLEEAIQSDENCEEWYFVLFCKECEWYDYIKNCPKCDSGIFTPYIVEADYELGTFRMGLTCKECGWLYEEKE